MASSSTSSSSTTSSSSYMQYFKHIEVTPTNDETWYDLTITPGFAKKYLNIYSLAPEIRISTCRIESLYAQKLREKIHHDNRAEFAKIMKHIYYSQVILSPVAPFDFPFGKTNVPTNSPLLKNSLTSWATYPNVMNEAIELNLVNHLDAFSYKLAYIKKIEMLHLFVLTHLVLIANLVKFARKEYLPQNTKGTFLK